MSNIQQTNTANERLITPQSVEQARASVPALWIRNEGSRLNSFCRSVEAGVGSSAGIQVGTLVEVRRFW